MDKSEWDSMLITEQLELTPESITTIKTQNTWAIEEYKERFESLVTKGYQWVNMHAYGVLNHKLIVNLDWPNSGTKVSVVASVNLSGPERWIQDKGSSLSGILEIEI